MKIQWGKKDWNQAAKTAHTDGAKKRKAASRMEASGKNLMTYLTSPVIHVVFVECVVFESI